MRSDETVEISRQNGVPQVSSIIRLNILMPLFLIPTFELFITILFLIYFMLK